MNQPVICFTAVFLKNQHGYVGFVEELPGLSAHGRTLEEARESLQRLAAIVFDEERANCEELLKGKDVVREEFRVLVALPPSLSSS